MTQLRRHSLLESCLNTATGFLVSFSLWPIVCRLILHEPFRPARGLGVIAFFTVLSVARNYLWRRVFNRRRSCCRWDEITGGEWLCEKHARERLSSRIAARRWCR